MLLYESNNQEYLHKLNKDLDFLLSFENKEELQAYLMKQIYRVAGGDVDKETATKAETANK